MTRKPKTAMAVLTVAVLLVIAAAAWWGISAATSGAKGHGVIEQDNSGPNLVGAQTQSEDQR